MAKAFGRMGNVFEGGADLTVLPCSAKGTVSTATRRWIELLNIPDPMSLARRGTRLGDISELIEFPGKIDVTKFVVFAAAVFNDFSETAALERIGTALGRITRQRSDITLVESPLLGTGAGGLPVVDSARALSEGFLSSCADDATLTLFVFHAEGLRSVQAAVKSTGIVQRLWDSLSLRPGMAGVSIDLKQLIRRKT